ncbi:tetratricopeptide repeat protein [Roseomonas chloroacetimidivorans]|uniref:tetratricopeptide repeat protein n=1 Tax=Roseomonas chloroacetimidivorans TaxID=1766656 RepID=UPI003C72DF17
MSKTAVSSLHVANEAFLVASTIERCPKTMMLRELVMNALEAAPEGTDAGKAEVRVTRKVVDGVSKLAVWNTGQGMSADELYSICDLASSLHKQNALDRNFGMGAKVASLPSNKHGLRYRSCRNGRVSEVTLGQRGGVYGRLIYDEHAIGIAATCVDATEQTRREGEHDLFRDWTEVVLFGNRPEQDTVASPYDGNPDVEPDWILKYLSRRFYRLPPGVRLTILKTASSDQPLPFKGFAERLARFDRVESVKTMGGVVVHYCHAADEGAREGETAPDGLPDLLGMGAIIHRDELYGLRSGQEWISDGPLFGIPFGGRHCTVFVELPDSFGVRAEAYRQFLRYSGGDQRQVALSDFAALSRDFMPQWLRDIIASYGPPRIDYTVELNEELSQLLIELDVPQTSRAASIPRGAETEQKPRKDRVKTRRIEQPPEIVGLRDAEQIEGRGLSGRAARYYPAPHQIFVNLTYSSALRLRAHLEEAFAFSPDAESRARLAADLAELVLTRQVARAVVYSLAKQELGWTPDEIARAQSPESLSVVADDYLAEFPAVRQRMAEMLGVSPPKQDEVNGGVSEDLRLFGLAADAEQAARRALLNPMGNPSSLLRRVSTIEAQRRNMTSALEWAHKALKHSPGDPASHHHLAGLLLRQGDFEGAELSTLRALELGPDMAARFMRQLSAIEMQKGNLPKAAEWALKAVSHDPDDALSRSSLAGVLMRQGQLAEAEAACHKALELSPEDGPRFMRQLSNIAAQRRDLDEAVEWARNALEASPEDPMSHNFLSSMLLQRKDLDGAEQAATRALQLGQEAPGRFMRQLSAIEMRRGNMQAAVDWAKKAIESDPADPLSHHHLSGLLVQQGNMAKAEIAAREALRLSQDHLQRE